MMKRGFTLIELLVVIAILGILIAISVPTFRALNDASEDATCKANISSILTGMNTYYIDNGRFPLSRDWVRTGVNGVDWKQTWASPGGITEGTLFPYMGTPKPYLCPSFEKEYDALRPDLSHLTPVVGYVLNEYFNPNGWQGSVNVFNGLRPQILFASHVGLVGEENCWKTPGYSNWSMNNCALGIGKWGTSNLVDSMGSFHQEPGGDYDNGFSNVGFADGHVELRHISETKEIFTPWALKREWSGDFTLSP